ncbi:MAG: isoprenylcysteine carboxylmethyltransferase family protein [Pseudomonadota bacterium]
MKGFPDLPPIWLAGFCLLAWVMALFAPVLSVRGPELQALGTALGIAGFGLIGWSAVWFARKGTTIEPHHTPQKLIVEGPYRLSRNPIYLGMVVILAGLVLWLGAVSGLVLPGVFVVVLTQRFIVPEENGLRSAFGAEAEAYLTRTRRWL